MANYSTDVTARNVSLKLNDTNSSDYYYFDDTVRWHQTIKWHCLVIFTAVGCTGNTLSLLVFLTSTLRASSTGIYLIALATCDTSILVLETVIQSGDVAVSSLSCQLYYYFCYSVRMLEALVVVSLCLDRTICLRCPFQSHKFSNMKVASLVMMTITVLSFTLCPYAFFTLIYYVNYCAVGDNSLYMFTDFLISILFGEVMTSIAVIIMTCYIIRALSLSRERQVHILRNSSSESVNKQLTVMTAALAVTFSLCRVPHSIVYIAYDIRHYILLEDPESPSQMYLAASIDIGYTISLINYCSNFVVYFVCWAAFRKKLCHLITLSSFRGTSVALNDTGGSTLQSSGRSNTTYSDSFV